MVASTGEPGPRWVPVISLDELWAGEMTSVVVDGLAVVVLNLDGDVVAFDNRCPHAGSPLAEGRLEGETLICSAHEWEFDSRSGQGVNPASACLRPIAVRVEDDVISVDVGRA
jgi:toluene monooxygenase system ferredoxin subunit